MADDDGMLSSGNLSLIWELHGSSILLSWLLINISRHFMCAHQVEGAVNFQLYEKNGTDAHNLTVLL